MLSRKMISRFVLRCLLFYVLFLVLSALGFNKIYADYFQVMGNKIASIVSHLDIEFKENQQSDQAKFDIEAIVMHPDTIKAYVLKARSNRNVNTVNVPSVTLAFNSTRRAYIPTIFLLTLILAAPLPFRWRKFSALIWGGILIHVYLVFQFSIWIIHECTTTDLLGLTIASSPFWKTVLHYLYLTFSADMPMRYIMPVLIWMLVCIRKEDLVNRVLLTGIPGIKG